MNEIPNITEENDEKSNYFKKIIPIYFFIILLVNVSLIFENPPWIGFLLVNIGLLFLGAVVLSPWWITKLPPDIFKNRLLRSIEEMEEKGHIEYEKFENSINCTSYSVGSLLFASFWAYLLIPFIYFQFKGIFSDSSLPVAFLVSFDIFVFIFLILIPAVHGMFGRDKIFVNPNNQTFVVRKNFLVFFYSKKKRIFPWVDVKFEIFPRRIPDEDDEEEKVVFNDLSELYRGSRLKIYFPNQYESEIQLVIRDDYSKIIPKAFKALIEGDHMSKLRALKSLSMYDKKFTRNRWIGYSICISIAVIEIILFRLFL